METLTLPQELFGSALLLLIWCAFGTLNYVWSKHNREIDLTGVSEEDRRSFYVDDSATSAMCGPFGTLILLVEALPDVAEMFFARLARGFQSLWRQLASDSSTASLCRGSIVEALKSVISSERSRQVGRCASEEEQA